MLKFMEIRNMWMRTLFENVLHRGSDKENLARFLKENLLFEGLTPKEAFSMKETLHKREYLQGETVFKEGEGSAAMYVIYSGSIEVQRGGKSIIRLGKGDFFGEMSLFDEDIRTATAVAVEDKSQLLVFSKGDLDDLINRAPATANKIMVKIAQVLAKRLRRMTEQKISGDLSTQLPVENL